jgi:hypothetical protein
MNKDHKNKWSRNNTVGALLRTAPQTAALPGFPGALQKFDQEMTRLRAAAARQAEPLSSAMLERDLTLQKLEQLTQQLAGLARAAAVEKKLSLVANKLRLRATAFRHLRAEQRVQLAEMVHATVEPLLADLGTHGLTQAMLDEHRAVIDAAARVVSVPREATVARRAATSELRDAFRAVDAVIEDYFDSLLLPLKESDPEFYERYRAARTIVNRPGSRAAADSDGADGAAPAVDPVLAVPNAA